MIRIANAPCSWGVLEFGNKAAAPGYAQVLDEMVASGYVGTEFGDWGFLPTEPAALRDVIHPRRLTLIAAFVPVALTDSSAHDAAEEYSTRVAHLLVAANTGAEFVVLADLTAEDANRTAKAGRITPADGLTPARWDVVAAGAERIARAVRDTSGLRTVFHHHCATFVETPAEVDALLSRADPSLLGLCIDTGHITYGGGNPRDLLARYGSRVWHMHFKDCSASVAGRARTEAWDYTTALRHGLFCELGQGAVDFTGVLSDLRALNYSGWIVVEQDVLPSMGTPKASAQRNRNYLATLGV